MNALLDRESRALAGWQKLTTSKHGLPLRKLEELTLFSEVTQLDQATRTAKVIIITEGLGNLRDKNFYTSDAVLSAAKIFEGKQCYIDHPSQREEEDRPERSIRDLCGYYFGCQIGQFKDQDTGEPLQALFANLRLDESESGAFAMAKIKASLEYQKQFPESKDVYAGISINGGGVSHPGTIKGMQVNMVSEISEAFSADIVTKPARGGRFLALIQEADRLLAWKKTQAQGRRQAQQGQNKESGMAQQAVLAKKPKVKESEKKVKGKVVVKGQESKKPVTKTKEAGENEAKATLMKAADMMRGIKVKMADSSGDPSALVQDLHADIDQLAQMIGGGGEPKSKAPQEAEDEEEAKETEDEDESKESEDEEESKEAEDEEESKESEDEEESKEAEDEDEEESSKESEDEEEAKETEDEEESEDEEEAKETEDEEEAKEAFPPTSNQMGAEDEMMQDEMGEYGMTTDEGGQGPMQFRCAKCGEVNEVAPPKGYRLSAMGESIKKTTEALAMKNTVLRLRRTLEAKEARFLKSNTQHGQQLQKVMQENIKLRAQVMANNRLTEARKQLKEAHIPRDILSPADLITFEPHQWVSQIKFAKRQMAREAKPLQRGGAVGGGQIKTKESEGGSKAAIAAFNKAVSV